ncbi:MAG: glycogen/starch/alpha-glucan phosphorylase, partial [Clostridiales bacterium]|nr:glycogen/starch/alpha-glucan phosphorylase [Clostridiales bacterium]
MFSDESSFVKNFKSRMSGVFGKSVEESSPLDQYMIVAAMLKEDINMRWMQTNYQYMNKGCKQIYYFSMEFLIGKLMDQFLIYFDVKDICIKGLTSLGIDYNEIQRQEPEAGLGNGGLGRLAACFLDSMATMGIPGHGCGIRFKYGHFTQKIVDGHQVELPDNWLKNYNVWEIRKPDKSINVKFGGNISTVTSGNELRFILEDYELVQAVPYDIPVPGYGNYNVNTLRLWSAEPASTEFDFASFNRGDYSKALEYKNNIEAISEVLYPDDSNYKNRSLRLKQEYFLVSAALQSVVRRFSKSNTNFADFPDKIALHVNDTHPALVVPELMRILMDDEGLGWDEAWKLTVASVSYTNHTVLPEALEKWPLDIFKNLLPRIYMIVNELNERFCSELWKRNPGSWNWISGLALISNGYVHMSHLAVVGSHSVNGVSRLHSGIVKNELFSGFYENSPEKFNNKTNGISLRRWILQANPSLASLITNTLGPGWITHPEELSKLISLGYDTDAAFCESFRKSKLEAKAKLADHIYKKNGIIVDTSSLFDVHVKRIHAFKRQLLNIMNILYTYLSIKDSPGKDYTPRTFMLAGKAAPSYYFAKKIVHLAHVTADLINNDKTLNDRLKVVFLEDYSVTLAESIFPAADLSQQISTAGKEASGTGNMKSIANGAIILGTIDGANVEIFDAVGESNYISFGLTVEKINEYKRTGGYYSDAFYRNDERIRRVLDFMTGDSFHPSQMNEFDDIRKSLLDYNDEFYVLNDFSDYVSAQDKAGLLYKDVPVWTRMAV